MAKRSMASGGRRWPLILLFLAILALGLGSLLSSFYIDLLWFQEVGFTDVFWTSLWSRILLGGILGLVFFALVYVNLVIARRVAPKHRVITPQQAQIEQLRRQVEPYVGWLLPLGSAVLAIAVAVAASRNWPTFLLWRNAGDAAFGGADPLFGRDPAFYVFDLPFYRFVQSWLFSTFMGVTLITAGAHFVFGGIRPQSPIEKVTPQVKAHLSVLLGLVVLAQAWGFWLQRFALLTSERGVVTGASYTDVKAQLPALNILTIVAIVCAILFLVNIRLRGWAFPVIGVGLLVLSAVVVAGIIPTAVQKFSVEPQELQREQPYIEDNIAFTRTAFGLDNIKSTSSELADDVPPDAVEKNADTIDNIRLWDPELLRQNFEQLQRIKPYYEFEDVDIDRYVLDGRKRMVMLSPREVSQAGIPAAGATWQNKHLVYTHGYGVAAALVNGADAQGAPLFVLSDIPPEGQPPELADELNGPNGQPRIYFGQLADPGVDFLAVNTEAEELDYQGTATDDQEQVTSHYAGKGGVPVGGLFRKLLFAWRFQDINLLISDLITPESRILLYRTIQERVSQAAPFLMYDSDPYSAIVDGRVVWIWDAYTATDQYPYSERIDLATATDGLLGGRVNYMRNSVKVVIDAYDGTMDFYVADPEDPIVQVWSKAFPNLFSPLDAAGEDLKAHFRYPENLFQVQASQFANYHVTDPTVFYQKQDFWEIPIDPAAQENGNPVSGSQVQGAAAPAILRPYYVLTALPGEPDEEFALILPFVPQGRQNMVAWMAARSDPEHYGEIVSYEFPSGTNVDGPVQVFNQINSFPRFSAERTLLGQGGSRLVFGNLLVMPLEGSFLYVQPIFVQSDQADAFPELKRVIVTHGGRIGIGATLPEALVDSGLGGGETPVVPGEPSSGEPGDPSPGVQQLLDRALTAFAAADEALKAGDLATYQAKVEEARELIQQAGVRSIAEQGATPQKGDGGASSGTGASPAASPVAASPSPAASPGA